MVYYVAYKASTDFRNRSRVVRHLRSLGCRQIRRPLWMVKRGSIGAAARLLQPNHPVILKRTKELRKPSRTKTRAKELGTLIIIALKSPKEENRSRIRSLFSRAPCIRLCHGVYAFSQWHRHFDKEQKLTDAWRFLESLRDIGEEVIIIPKLVAVDHDSTMRLLGKAEERVQNEITNVIEGYRSLGMEVSRAGFDERNARNKAGKLRKRFRTIREISAFYRRWLKVDQSNLLIRPYSIIKKTRTLVEEKYETIEVQSAEAV